MAVTKAAGLLGRGRVVNVPEGFGYTLKRRLLGPPLVSAQLSEERLSKPLALGVLSCDGISSAAYGTEEILIELVPIFGVAAYSLILPMTAVVLAGIALVVLSYREVVSVYTRAGGSYVVARENFGPRVAQVAAVALLIDYVVTVAVQVAAGSAAIVSAFPALGSSSLEIISVIAILVMAYGNLRGIREAGRTFALPTYLFSGAVVLMLIVGVAREAVGGLPLVHPARGMYSLGHWSSGLLTWGAIYVLLRAFANGGSSLTGIEAVSNAVSALRPPEGRNARQILVMQGSVVALLIGGISWLAHVMHARPYTSGFPTVLAQEANLVFGHSVLGRVLFFGVQAGTAAILFTGGNTSFSGFPFLASFVAEDSFLPRWLTKRGHRLVFSNGIIVLTVVSLTLGLVVGFKVNSLIPFYAIGVFTGFSMAGFGMAKYHVTHKEQGWRRRLVINVAGGVYTAIVVLIFAVVKFTEGAWLVVIIFPLMVFVLIRLNREYRMESRVLATITGRQPPPPPHYARRTVLVFVDSFDLATLAALRYARSLRPTALRAVHFVIDGVRADTLRRDWSRADRGVPLDLVDAPDRRLTRAASDLVCREIADPGTHVTVILPRRSYSPLLGRFLHDRTADKIAGVVSRIPRSAATIIPYDVQSRLEELHDKETSQEAGQNAVVGPAGTAADGTGTAGPAPDGARSRGTAPAGPPPADRPRQGRRGHPQAAPAARKDPTEQYEHPVPPPGVDQIGGLTKRGRATVVGRVHSVEIRPAGESSVFAATMSDSTGELAALFYGRQHIAGIEPGVKIRLTGAVGIRDGVPTMVNPNYELLS